MHIRRDIYITKIENPQTFCATKIRCYMVIDS